MRVLLKLAVAALAAAAGPLANAAIVTTWTYTVNTTFVVPSVCFQDNFDGTGNQSGTGCPVPTANPADTTTSPLAVSWGIPFTAAGPSSLVITGNPATGTIDTTTPPFSNPTGTTPPGNEIGLTQIFTHNNNAISLGHTLDFISALSLLTLVPTVPPGAPGQESPVPPFPPAQAPFLINFAETSNNAATCDPASQLTPPVNCPDIFAILGPLGAPNAFNVFSFFYDSDGAGPDPTQQYFVSIFPTTNILNTLSNAACAKAGAQPGCQGFITEEGQANSVQFAFALTTVPFQIPEPGILTLFSAALIGLGFALRKKQA